MILNIIQRQFKSERLSKEMKYLSEIEKERKKNKNENVGNKTTRGQ